MLYSPKLISVIIFKSLKQRQSSRISHPGRVLSDLAVGLQSGLNVSQLCCAVSGGGRKGKSDSLGDEAMLLLKDELHVVPELFCLLEAQGLQRQS